MGKFALLRLIERCDYEIWWADSLSGYCTNLSSHISGSSAHSQDAVKLEGCRIEFFVLDASGFFHFVPLPRFACSCWHEV
jgi:hypothetical protein